MNVKNINLWVLTTLAEWIVINYQANLVVWIVENCVAALLVAGEQEVTKNCCWSQVCVSLVKKFLKISGARRLMRCFYQSSILHFSTFRLDCLSGDSAWSSLSLDTKYGRRAFGVKIWKRPLYLQTKPLIQKQPPLIIIEKNNLTTLLKTADIALKQVAVSELTVFHWCCFRINLSTAAYWTCFLFSIFTEKNKL